MQPAAQSLPALSVLGQRWVFPSPENARLASSLAQSVGLPTVVASILASRGYTQAGTIANFLNPRLEQLPDPNTLKDMPQAVEILTHALTHQTTIGIFGDYDVDGTCATALLTRYLRALGHQPVIYIPDRLTEGYGPTPQAMHKLKELGVQLLITVDTGTTAHAALQEAQSLGLRVLVTDHHQPEGTLPPAAAILNPHRPDDTSELQGLCGSGVVFYLLLALNRHLRQSGFFQNIPEPKLTTYLDMVALATVADVMHLTGTNRVLVAKGLQQLGTWQHAGLRALASVAGVRDDLSTHSLGFALAPRLNAAGRIDSAQAALNLLLADTLAEAEPAAHTLNHLNLERQAMEKTILAQARQQAEEIMAENPETLGLVLHHESWHPGVVGIVAARIKEAFNRPTFILGTDSNSHLKGSGRSITGLNLGAAVHASKPSLLSGGGHAMAAGVTLEPHNLAAFRRELNSALWQQLETRTEDAHLPLQHRLAPTLNLEATTSVSGLNAQLVETLSQLAPFGAGNPEPVLAIQHARVVHAKPVGATQEHLKLKLADSTGTGSLDAIAFGACLTPLGQVLSQSGGRSLSIAATAKLRTFNGKPMLDVYIKDALLNNV